MTRVLTKPYEIEALLVAIVAAEGGEIEDDRLFALVNDREYVMARFDCVVSLFDCVVSLADRTMPPLPLTRRKNGVDDSCWR